MRKMTKDPKISNIQIRGLLVSITVGGGALTLPDTLTNIMGKDGWISILLTGILIIPILWIINQLFIDHPNKDYFEIIKSTLGNIVLYIYMAILGVYFIILLAFITRNLGELVKTFLLPNTPVEIIIVLFILACSYIAIYEVDSIARAGYFIYPIIILTIFVLLLISLPTADFTDILPMFQSDISQLPKGIMASFFSFGGYEILLFTLPYVEDNKKTFKSSLLGLAIIIITYTSIFIVNISQFNVEQIKRQIYPTLMLAKHIDLPGYFLQNLDGIFMSIWVLIIFASMSPIYFVAGKTLSKIVKSQDHKYFICGLIPIIYFLALIPQNVAKSFITFGKYLNILGIISTIIFPIIIFVVGRVKKKVAK